MPAARCPRESGEAFPPEQSPGRFSIGPPSRCFRPSRTKCLTSSPSRGNTGNRFASTPGTSPSGPRRFR